ncbi:MAG: FHA domain-containing protein [Firmicutes bacterium]|nr:FHA domain-containing protein [Bacillota bacterium]
MGNTQRQNLQPRLIVIGSQGELHQYEFGRFGGPVVRIGRKPEGNDIVIGDGFVSSHHGRIFLENGRFYYCDDRSSNGSFVISASGTSLLKNTDVPVELSNHSTIRIGSASNPDKRILIWFSFMNAAETVTRKDLGQSRITIGRAETCDIVLAHPSISRVHATITRQDGRYVLADSRSTNGILVNGQPLEHPVILESKDVIQISGFQMIYAGDSIYYKDQISGIGIIARNINKIVGSGKGKKQILHQANVTINANEFVAIIGGSGAGKSTIMNVLNGFDRSYTGEVFFNNINLKRNFQYLKSIIGYVPQEDIIYENLTLRKMLQYTAQLRMPKDISRGEIQARIDSVLHTLDLTQHQNTLIRKMSGGQKKRASIAVELLADPKLFFLDEPTSGLDPGTEKSLMISMRKLCKEQSRTIIMVTHTTQSLHLCDKVVFMGPGGRVCFVGHVDEAKKFFGNDDLTEIYNIIAKNPAFWERRFAQTGSGDRPAIGTAGDVIRNRRPRVPAVNQFVTLVSRYTELLMNDRRKLLILMLEPILIGLLLYIVAGTHVFDVFNTEMPKDLKETPIAILAYNQTKSIMFTLSCAAIWIGLFNSIQEICKERSILKREYMANLLLPVYMGSKVIVQMVIGLVQAVLLTMTFLLTVDHFKDGGKVEIRYDDVQTLFNGGGEYLEIILTVWLTIIASMALGLIVSSIVKSGDKAMVVAPFLLIVQLLFSGFLFDLKDTIGEVISYVTVSKWSVEGLCRIANLGNIGPDFVEKIKDEPTDFDWNAPAVLADWWVMALMALICIAVSVVVLRSVARDGR